MCARAAVGYDRIDRMPAQPMIKGGAIREFFAWYERRFGAEAVRAMAARVPDDLRDALDPDEPIVRILSASWYPASLVHAMLDALAEGRTSQEVDRLARDASREVVKNGMNSVYRFLLEKLVSPEIYARMIPRLWHQLHSTGVRTMTILGEGEAESRITRWPGHHPALCALTNELMCAIFETMGCRNVRWERVRCITHDGGDTCVSRVTWLRR